MGPRAMNTLALSMGMLPGQLLPQPSMLPILTPHLSPTYCSVFLETLQVVSTLQ